ncbi:histidinol dehydrogenase [Paralimibaculum aggregatum]|uniref:Histidinol dehydrogenase n=1 Tax=Paralimibaculum aggregatum TaxID=3036245 RepID=A0ABQ6LR07_9RHOB|nr:histidinol dehydrogenase [Limibaculum sp. NKW23]GMG83391.1 histidinol dehydrogenase [Limibaculum sp. NKW23]
MPELLRHDAPDFEARFARLVSDERAAGADVRDAVAEILADIRARGIAAVIERTRLFDRWEATEASLAVTAEEIDAAVAEVAPERLEALELAAERIRAYHIRQMPGDADWTDAAGARLGWRWGPVDAAGLYVPGGLASYPSSLLMNAIPAKVAGVGRLAVCAPCPEGRLNPLVLAAARVAGIDEIWRIGGAQAIGALAYGAGPIRGVDKITGPGNAYVAEAKRQVFGRVGIDMIAGPSEVLVIADAGNDPDWLAMDLLAQAEHDSRAQSILVTDDAALAEAVPAAVERALQRLSRAGIAGASWRDYGGVILVDTLARAAEIANRVAPEHLELCVADPEALMGQIRHAGAIFLGRHTPEAIGDYVGGPNHVLPTAGSARFSSGLSVLDFLKRTTLAALDGGALAALGPAAETLAEAEGLEAHGLSVALRRADAG